MTEPPALIAPLRYHAAYMEWAKTRAVPDIDLAGSNILACSIEDLPDAREAVDLAGANDNGYRPLTEAIAARYGVDADRVTTAGGTSGANFLVYAALLSGAYDLAAGSGIHFEPAGSRALKGVDDPVQTYAVAAG